MIRTSDMPGRMQRQATSTNFFKLVADLLTTAGADRALIVDCTRHGWVFNIQVDHLFISPVLVDHFKQLFA